MSNMQLNFMQFLNANTLNTHITQIDMDRKNGLNVNQSNKILKLDGIGLEMKALSV